MKIKEDSLVVETDSWRNDPPVKPPFKWEFHKNYCNKYGGSIIVYGRATTLGTGFRYGFNGWEWHCLRAALDDKEISPDEVERIGQTLVDIWQMKYDAYLTQKGLK